MTNLALDAAHILLMAKVAAQMNDDARRVFWEFLPDIIPDLTACLPALTTAVRDETNWGVLDTLSLFPLPTALSAETAGWRQGLINAWEKQMNTARKALDNAGCAWDWEWGCRYTSSLRGLIQTDRCGMPPGTTCPSILPTLLNGARYTREKFMGNQQSYSEQFECLAIQLQCLSVLADWRPGPGVMTDPAVLNEWANFWLALYQKPPLDIREEEHDAPIILKGIAAKVLLNLIETDEEKETGLLAGLKSHLLESLMRAADVAGEQRVGPCIVHALSWLSWQPQNVTRFHLDRLAELPKTLLRRFSLSCQNASPDPYRWFKGGKERVIRLALTELVRWDRAGLLADCGIDLLPCVVTGLSEFLNEYVEGSHDSLNPELCRWLARDEVANVGGGRKLLQKFENHWCSECHRKYSDKHSRIITWYGRMQLQQAGLATEPAADFHEDRLEAIKKEKDSAVRIVLSLCRPEKDAPEKMRKELDTLWKKKLKSSNKKISTAAALALLRPDPADADDIIARREKLRDILPALPKEILPKLSIAEMTYLMEEVPPESLNAAPHVNPNRPWQFRHEDARFRLSTERAARVSTPVTVQPACPDRTIQSIAGDGAAR